MRNPTPTQRETSLLSLVLEADPDFYYESRYPVVYRFPTHEFRSSGPNSGPYGNFAQALDWTADNTMISADGTLHTADLT